MSITNGYQQISCICWMPHNDQAPVPCLLWLLVHWVTFEGFRLLKWFLLNLCYRLKSLNNEELQRVDEAHIHGLDLRNKTLFFFFFCKQYFIWFFVSVEFLSHSEGKYFTLGRKVLVLSEKSYWKGREHNCQLSWAQRFPKGLFILWENYHRLVTLLVSISIF